MQALPDSVAPTVGAHAEAQYITRAVRFLANPDSPSPVTAELYTGLVIERAALLAIINGASVNVPLGGGSIGADTSGVDALQNFARAVAGGSPIAHAHCANLGARRLLCNR